MQRALPLLRAQIAQRTLVTASRAVRPVVAARPASLVSVDRVSAVRFEKRFLTQGSPAAWKDNKDVSYDEIKPLTQQPSDDILLIDVREPDEVMLGSIPSSVNIPLSNFEKALLLDEGDFLRAYGFRRPSKDQKMIFYCKTGKRSSTATGLAKTQGFKHVRNYPGSWAEWSSKQSKDDD